jgi:hypothetical protein
MKLDRKWWFCLEHLPFTRLQVLDLLQAVDVTAQPEWAACEVLPCISCLLPDAAMLYPTTAYVHMNMCEPEPAPGV